MPLHPKLSEHHRGERMQEFKLTEAVTTCKGHGQDWEHQQFIMEVRGNSTAPTLPGELWTVNIGW